MIFEIKVTCKDWQGYSAVCAGHGGDVASALGDASKLIGSPFRPKQDGTAPKLINITMERPDGTRFNIHPQQLKMAVSSLDLEAFNEDK